MAHPSPIRRSVRRSKRPVLRPDPTPLLLAPGLSSETVAALLKPYGIEDPKRADANIQAMAGEPR
ncbi:MAG: hypothetical protein C4293_09655, partial [Nitrospiraceae bacterium]